MPTLESAVHFENDDVKVIEWRLEAGASTGHHRHGFDYVVVPVTTGRLKSLGAAGESFTDFTPGKAYFRKAGVEHDVFNVGGAPLAFIEVELKQRPG